jgi:DNA repair protein RadC
MRERWQHPGGKLRELGAGKLSEAEILAILISPGIRGRPAETIADEILERFGSLEGLANQPLERLLDIKGLSDVKIIRLAAAFELALRLARKRKPNLHEKGQ